MNDNITSNLLKTTSILLIGKFAIQLANFLLLPVYTSVLTLADYGTIELYNTLSMIIVPIITLQIEQAIFRRLLIANSKKEKEEIIASALYTVGITVTIFSCIYIFFTSFINIENKKIIYFYYVSMIPLPILQQICRGYQENIKYTLGTFINSLSIILITILLVIQFHLGIIGVLCGSILGNLVGFIYYLYVIKQRIKIRFGRYNKTIAYSMLIYSVPLILNQFSSWIINYSDRWLIVSILGLQANGLYAIANKFFLLPMTFFNVYNLAWTENIIVVIKKYGYSDFINLILNFTAHIYLLFINFLLLILPYLFPVLIKPDFRLAFYHIPILLLAAFLVEWQL